MSRAATERHPLGTPTTTLLLWSMAICLLGGFVLSLAGTAIVRRLAMRWGFVDLPGGHKRHREPVALGGGVAIAAALVLPMVAGFVALEWLVTDGRLPAWCPEALQEHVPGLLSKSRPALGIAAGLAILHVLGLIDDRRQLGPLLKLTVQLAVAAGVTWGVDLRILTVAGEPASGVLTVVWIVIMTNAFNLLDNMDGLCAGVAAIAASVFAMAAIRAQQVFVPSMAFLMVGTMLGYLWFNFPPARIYMGDAGSLVIGFFMAVLTILTTYFDTEQRSQPALLMPLIVLAVPLYDTASVIVIRLRRGLNPLRGDQRHFSHRLVQRGLSPRNAVLTIYMATLATSLSATVLPTASWRVAAVVVVQCLCVVGIIAILESTERQRP